MLLANALKSRPSLRTFASAVLSQPGAPSPPTYSPIILNEIRANARKNPTSVSLHDMFEFGTNPTPSTLLRGAKFLRKELPIRLARRAAELDSLPYGLSLMPSVQRVRSWYITSFLDLQKYHDICNHAEELAFTETLKKVLKRHEHVVPGLFSRFVY
jgi:pyruvate dehydrogenase kinase 2/3/4